MVVVVVVIVEEEMKFAVVICMEFLEFGCVGGGIYHNLESR